MKTTLFRRLLAGFSLFALLLDHASATVVPYWSSSAFDAAVTGELSPNFTLRFDQTKALVIPSFTFETATFTSDNMLVAVGAGKLNARGANYLGSFLTALSASGSVSTNLKIDIPVGTTAIGFTYGDYVRASDSLAVALSTKAENFTLTPNLTTPLNKGYDTDFIGFTSDSAITSVTFSLTGMSIDITKFILATATPVPEPGSLALLGLGLLGLSAVRRKKQV